MRLFLWGACSFDLKKILQKLFRLFSFGLFSLSSKKLKENHQTYVEEPCSFVLVWPSTKTFFCFESCFFFFQVSKILTLEKKVGLSFILLEGAQKKKFWLSQKEKKNLMVRKLFCCCGCFSSFFSFNNANADNQVKDSWIFFFKPVCDFFVFWPFSLCFVQTNFFFLFLLLSKDVNSFWKQKKIL